MTIHLKASSRHIVNNENSTNLLKLNTKRTRKNRVLFFKDIFVNSTFFRKTKHPSLLANVLLGNLFGNEVGTAKVAILIKIFTDRTDFRIKR